MLLVLVLLGAIYRSPLIALIPLVVVGFAYSVAQGLIYLYAKSGATVSTQLDQILVVLMFGVGTDYCLLLVSRYREELRRHEDKHEAMARAVRRVGPGDPRQRAHGRARDARAAASPTRGSIHSLGPGRGDRRRAACWSPGSRCCRRCSRSAGGAAFWPRRQTVAYDPEPSRVARAGIWRRIGDRVLQRPGRRARRTVALFGGGALGLLAYKEDYSITNVFKKPTESVDGFRVLERAFPAGALEPDDGARRARRAGRSTAADVAAVTRRLAARAGRRGGRRRRPSARRDGTIARFDVVFDGDPYTDEALAACPEDCATRSTALAPPG